MDLNGEWNFRLPEEKVWTQVDVPHTFNVFRGLDGYVGPVEYEKRFTLEAVAPHNFLHFLEVRNKAQVFVNGHEAGTHETGYTSFSFDVTPWLKEGKNIITAVVDNSLDDDHPPNLIGWKNYGGITREAFLEQAPEVYSDRVVVRTDLRFSDGAPTAGVSVRAQVKGGAAELVKAELYSPEGNLLAERSGGPVAEDEFVSMEFEIENPRLWEIGSGHLYKVAVVAKAADASDRTEHFFGIRDARVGKANILLNGRPIYIKGTARHEDFPETGCVETVARMEHDLELIREAGFNAIRLAHYPYHPAFIDMCDRAGILVIEEVPVWNTTAKIMSRPAFLENSLEMVTEMVERDINHPSIIAWGIGNEVEADSLEGQSFLERLKERVREADPTRPVYTTFRKKTDIAAASIPDFLALNVKLGWYHGEATDLGLLLDEWRRQVPDKPIVLTEHSGGAAPGFRSPAFVKWSEEYQAYLLHYYYKVLHSKPYVAGDFVWPCFDYRDPAKSLNPIPFFNIKGIMTLERERKLSCELMKRLNSGEEPERHYITGYEQRPTLLTSGRFYGAKALTLLLSFGAMLALNSGKRFIGRPLLVFVTCLTTGILLRDVVLEKAINPAMFTGTLSEWISCSLRPIPSIPVTLLYLMMIPLSASVLILSYKTQRKPSELLAATADSLWPALALPFAFFFPSLYWLVLLVCFFVILRRLHLASGEPYSIVLFVLISPAFVLSVLCLSLLHWRYEFLTYLTGYLFHGM